MTQKTFKWDYLKKSPDTSGSDPNCFGEKKSTFSEVLDSIEDVGRRDWTRTNDPHHVKVLFAVKSKCVGDYKQVN